jgi:hypothetical protein
MRRQVTAFQSPVSKGYYTFDSNSTLAPDSPGVVRCHGLSQTPGTLGNESRNQVFGPHQRRLDFSVVREFPIREDLRLQFRGEFFNLTNTANLAQPGSAIGNNLGVISSTSPGATPREIQFSLKVLF